MPKYAKIRQVNQDLFTYQETADYSTILKDLCERPHTSPALHVRSLYQILLNKYERCNLNKLEPLLPILRAYSDDSLRSAIERKRRELDYVLAFKKPSEHEKALKLYRELVGLMHEQCAWSEILAYVSHTGFLPTFLRQFGLSSNISTTSPWPDTTLHPDFYTSVNQEYFESWGMTEEEERQFFTNMERIKDLNERISFLLRSRNLIVPLYKWAMDDDLCGNLVPLKRHIDLLEERLECLKRGVMSEASETERAVSNGQRADDEEEKLKWQAEAQGHVNMLYALQTELIALDRVITAVKRLPEQPISLRQIVTKRITKRKSQLENFQKTVCDALARK